MKRYMKKLIIVDLINHIVKMKLFLVGTLFLFFACNGQKKTAMKNGEELNSGLELIASDNHSGAEISETLVITNYEALKLFYSKINMTRKPGLPLPEVDFKKEMVVITCSGEGTDSPLPTLKVKEETASQMVLSTDFLVDEKNTSQAITSPFSVYKMPLTDKEIVFQVANQ